MEQQDSMRGRLVAAALIVLVLNLTGVVLLWRDRAAVRDDVSRLEQMWGSLLQQYGGPMLFGDFSIADAFFAPVCMRLHSYQLPLSPLAAGYMERVRALPSVQQWIQEALAENDFREFEEPYRLHR